MTGVNLRAVRAVVWKDLKVLRGSKAVMGPLLIVPLLFFVLLPALVGWTAPQIASAQGATVSRVGTLLAQVAPALRTQLAPLAEAQQVVVLLGLYLLAPMFLMVPTLVSSVIAADSFAGERERGTFESLAYSPIRDGELFLAKVIAAWVPAVLVSLVGFVLYGTVLNAAAWPVMERVFFPNLTWVLLATWVGPGVAALALGATVMVSARVRTFQEAFQLGGVVVLPLILLVVGQAAGVVYLSSLLAFGLGALVWVVALALLYRGARSFRRTRVMARA